MRSIKRHSTLGLVAVAGFTFIAGSASYSPAAAAALSDMPSVIMLEGVVRDFHASHPDFEVTPMNGFGHYAGNVEPFIGPGRKPVFSGGGRKVTSQFTDSAGRPIAPHLYNMSYVPPMTGEAPNMTQVILKDSVGANAYEITWLSTVFNNDGTSTWSYRVRELAGGRDLSHWNIALAPGQQVVAGTTPGYDLGVDGSTGFYGIKWDVQDEFSVGVFTIVLDGHYYGSDLQASVLAKGGAKPDVGDLFAPTNNVSTTGSPFITDHMLMSYEHGDSEGSLGNSDTGGVQDGESFRQWFFDAPGVNLSKSLAIPLELTGDGTYVFDSSDHPDYEDVGGFFPIDNQLFGNTAGADNNQHFTYELHASFTYDESENQFFKFIGDDDVWVFIDGKLAIDLGGIHSVTEQYIDLSRMGLEDGETYNFDFFFAERHTTESNFRIETNMVLETVVIPSISAAFD